MEIMLIQPPQGDPSQPYTSLAVLLSAWRGHGLSVTPDDLNLEFFNYLCRSDTLADHIQMACSKLSEGAYHDSEEETLLRRSVELENMLSTGIVRALAVLRDAKAFYEPNEYAWAVRFINRYLEAICTPYYPGRVTLQSFKTAHSHLSSFEILAAAEDSATNPFIRFIEQEVAHRYRRQAPEVAAISVTFQTQLIPAFTLARYIKQWLPGTRVVMGGAALARTHVPLTNTPHLFRDVDAVVLYEGETAFPALLEEWEQGKDGLDAPNVILPGTERMRQAKMRHIESLATLSAPDHAGLLLRDYWWPEPALLYNCARGCYWGRCAFCQISPATIGEGRGNYRLRPIEMIISDLDTMQRQTGAMSFNLAVDALPPRALQEIGSAIKQSGLNLTWDTEIRLENGLDRSVLRAMSEGGCRHVRFGFESASQRVLDLMNKGTTVENTRRILDDCRAAGITVSLMCQSGFPGETYAESLETVNFLKQEKDKVAFLSMVPYVLESGSDVFREPERFGIVVHENPPHEDLSWMYNYDGPDGRGVVENYAFFEKVEQSLDDSFPDRDLFFKGGLGHAHTSLYVRRYPFETFISWNERPCRVPGAFSEDKLLRTSSFMVITQNSGNRGTSGWSRFTLAVLETPEYLFTVDGSALLVLASCTTPRPARLIADWIRRLSWWVFSREESLAIVREFYENGLFLAAREQTGTMAP